MPKTLPAGRPIRIALCGNPNTGKSTLFGALSGVRQRVGNYPGVTVEKKLGSAKMNGRDYTIIDLPGTYSLAPQSMDEMVSVDVLLGRQEDVGQPDAIVCIVDASNLQRNLYLVCQVLELRRPTVVALNMTDVASAKGIDINVALLAERIGVTVVPIQANSRKGLDNLKQAIVQALEKPTPAFHSPFSEAFCAEVQTIHDVSSQESATPLPHYLIQRLILDTGYLHEAKLPGVSTSVMSAVDSARQRLAATSDELVSIEPIARYSWINQVTQDVIHRPDEHRVTLSDRIDHVVTHRIFGTGIFALLMLIIFQAVFGFAPFFSDLIESGIGEIGSWVGGLLPPGALRSLMLNGVFAGVGGVLVFLPQIAILFLFIAILEDCGYMSRAAYLMDKSMSAIGLNGKSFIPLLSSFACAVPGIMAARVIENRRDRFITILVAPLMSCSARIPVYVLLTSAFIPSFAIVPWILNSRSLVFFLMYFIGIVVAVLVAWLLKRTILKGETPPFVMELPSYKVPDWRIVLHRVWERCWAFVYRAGTLIFAVSILVWAAGYYPRSSQSDTRIATEIASLEARLESSDGNSNELDAKLERLRRDQSAAQIRSSYLGQAGQCIEPVVRPLGWDWRIGCAVVASFPAREVVVSTLGVIFNLGDEQDEGSAELRDALRRATWEGSERPLFTIPVALSVMVFFALCAQCVSTLAIIRREMNSWRWAVFSFVYMTGLAYVAAFLTTWIGNWFV